MPPRPASAIASSNAGRARPAASCLVAPRDLGTPLGFLAGFAQGEVQHVEGRGEMAEAVEDMAQSYCELRACIGSKRGRHTGCIERAIEVADHLR